ncbi:MAG TPA: ATP-binding protein [Solirubrobacteraceae bacterium]|nr:ATP-binding protein [Solirubrobacteraceae bacterium]
MLRRPEDIFDRDVEWNDLASFATAPGLGLWVAVVYGRRRQGKSYLLRRLARATGGFYHQALEEESGPALERLGGALGEWLKVPGGRLALADWSAAVDAISALRVEHDAAAVVVLDELPYLLDRVPELPSLLQRAVDASQDAPNGQSMRLVLCGSALSVMSELLSGQRALRGRIATTIKVDPFDYREAAAYWGLGASWPVALRLHAILGGTPGYRDLLGLDPPRNLAGIGQWLAAGVFSPASALFREDDYLLAEERGLTDRALYHSALSAIAAGNRSETKIAAALGRERQAVSWPLRVLLDAGFLIRDEDALRQRRPSYRIAEPIVRFHHAITRRDLTRFEERRAVEAWENAQERFSTHVLGPHLEDLARRWTARYACERTLGGRLGRVGATQLADRQSRSQIEVDVVGLAADSERVAVLGEAKASTKPVGLEVLTKLDRTRELVGARAPLAPGVKLLVFSAGGFDRALSAAAQRRADVELVDLERLYRGD